MRLSRLVYLVLVGAAACDPSSFVGPGGPGGQVTAPRHLSYTVHSTGDPDPPPLLAPSCGVPTSQHLPVAGECEGWQVVRRKKADVESFGTGS